MSSYSISGKIPNSVDTSNDYLKIVKSSTKPSLSVVGAQMSESTKKQGHKGGSASTTKSVSKFKLPEAFKSNPKMNHSENKKSKSTLVSKRLKSRHD